MSRGLFYLGFPTLVLLLATGCSPDTSRQRTTRHEPKRRDEPALRKAVKLVDAQKASAPSVSVMTYNVNYRRLSRSTLRVIRRVKAELVFLQETTWAWERAIRDRLRGAYKHMVFRHFRGAGGLAVLSRFPVESAQVIESPVGKFPAWIIRAKTSIGPLQVLHLHLRPIIRGRRKNIVSRYLRSQDIRIRETRAYLPHLDPELPTVLLGDFNEDINGSSLRLLGRKGFKSATARFAPNAPTWRWRTRTGTFKWQLDHILHGPRLRARHARVIDAGASDHLPVLAILEAKLRPGKTNPRRN